MWSGGGGDDYEMFVALHMLHRSVFVKPVTLIKGE